MRYRRPACPMPCTRARTPPPRLTSRPTSWRRPARWSPTPSSTPPPTGSSQLFHAAGPAPGDHVAFCLENHPRYFEVAWGAHYAGLYLHRHARHGSRRASWPTSSTTARPRSSSRRCTRPTRPPRSSPDTPGVQLRLMLDGTVDGYDSRTRTPSPPSRPSRSPDRSRGDRHALLVGHDRPAEGHQGAAARRAARRRARRAGAAADRLCSASTGDDVYLSPAPLYHAAPLRFSMAMQRLGGTVVVMEHFDAEQFLAARSSSTASPHTPVRADDVHPHAEAARGGPRPLRRVVAADRSSTPPRRARSPVKQQMIEWWGPIIHEYYAGTEGNGFVLHRLARTGWPTRARSAGRSSARSTSSTRTATSCRPARPGTIYFEGGGDFEYHNDPEKTAGVAQPARAGRRSATSATSTTTATSTSPTARRS